MKYLITESRMNSLIEGYILKNYSEVKEVRFKNKKKMLGSYEGSPIIDETIIVVIFENSDNKLSQHVLSKLRVKIIEEVDQLFGLDWQEYGSGWGFEFGQLAVVNIAASLYNI